MIFFFKGVLLADSLNTSKESHSQPHHGVFLGNSEFFKAQYEEQLGRNNAQVVL